MKEAGVALATILIQGLTAAFLLYRVVQIEGLKGLKKADYKPLGGHSKEITSSVIESLSVSLITGTRSPCGAATANPILESS